MTSANHPDGCYEIAWTQRNDNNAIVQKRQRFTTKALRDTFWDTLLTNPALVEILAIHTHEEF